MQADLMYVYSKEYSTGSCEAYTLGTVHTSESKRHLRKLVEQDEVAQNVSRNYFQLI